MIWGFEAGFFRGPKFEILNIPLLSDNCPTILDLSLFFLKGESRIQFT